MKKKPHHEWEIKHKLLNNKSVDGFQYWNYMRRDMFMSFGDEAAGIDPPFYREMKEHNKTKGALDKIRKALIILSPGNGKIKKSDILFLCHGRRQEIDGKMVSIYTDYIADHFPGSLTLQRSGKGKYDNSLIYTKNLFFLDNNTAKAHIYRYLVKYFNPQKYKQVRNQIFNEMKEPFRDLSENYNLHPDLNDFAERATILFFLYKYNHKSLSRLLKRISPKVIVEIVGASFYSLIINEIAYETGIKVIELQHGTISPWYPDNITIRQYPQWFFTFGDFWTSSIKPPLPKNRIMSMGFPYHDIMMEEYPREKQKHDKNTIIFLSSNKYGKELSFLAAELKKLRPETEVIFKLHPKEIQGARKRYPALNGSGLRVIEDTKTPLYQLFSESSMQVGVESTSIYEGMSFGLKTYIWDIPNAAPLKQLSEKGYATLFQNAQELSSMIDKDIYNNISYDAEAFWKSNSMENILNGIKEILSL